jgi:hypothetical protein
MPAYWIRLAHAGAAALLINLAAPAWAVTTYTVTTYSAGSGRFYIDGLLDIPSPDAWAPYTLKISATFDEPGIYNNAPPNQRTYASFGDVKIDFELTSNGITYRKTQDDGGAYITYRAYNDTYAYLIYTIELAPSTRGERFLLTQQVEVKRSLMSVSDVLKPGMSLSTATLSMAELRSPQLQGQLLDSDGLSLAYTDIPPRTYSYAVTAVPEPSIWMLTLLGCGVIAVLSRGRSARGAATG